MNLLRGVGRAMLATFFVSNGVKAIKDPASLVPAAEPLARKFVPLAQKKLPESVTAYLPEDTKSLVRLNGGLSVLGGVGMATNISSRGGGGLAALAMLPHLIASVPTGSGEKKAARAVFVRNLALTGAALVVSQDTKGDPSMTWRATDLGVRLGRRARQRTDELAKDAQRRGKHTQRTLDKSARQHQVKFK